MSSLFFCWKFANPTSEFLLTILGSLLFMESCLYRREEKLYVEGMEDEDMKKETQNLAYPPAFKLGKIFINCCH